MAKYRKSFVERIKPTGFKDLLRRIVLLICVCVFCYSAYNLGSIFLEYKQMDDSNKKIEETYVTEAAEEEGAYKKIDFDALLKRNPDVKGWIDIPDTRVSYPILQGETNDTYIHSDIDKKEFRAGSIFIASENENPFVDLNTVIYGHNMKIGGEMFSQLKEYEEESFYKEHPNFYIYTPDGKTRTYTVFSAAVVKDTADQYNLTYATDEAFESYLKMCKEDSAYDTGTEVNAQSQIVSLSTCTNVKEDERFLLQGVLTATDGGEN